MPAFLRKGRLSPMISQVQLRSIKGIAAFVMLAVCLSTSCGATEPLKQLSRSGMSGQPIYLGGYMRIDKSCDGLNLPKAVLDVPPAHGTLCYEIRQITRPKLTKPVNMFGNPWLYPQCVGRRVRGIGVMYVSAAGYAGPDTLKYKINFGKAEAWLQVDATVNVRAGEANLAKGAPLVETPRSPQQLGPIPRCVALIS